MTGEHRSAFLALERFELRFERRRLKRESQPCQPKAKRPKAVTYYRPWRRRKAPG